MFSQDLAVDLGTSHIRVYQRGEGVVAEEPTVVAVHSGAFGRRVLALGREALPMIGRTPDNIDAIRPIRGGAIDNYEVSDALLTHLVRRVHGRNGWVRPRMVVAVDHGATQMSVRAVRDSCESAGARDVRLVSRPLAAAAGAELDIHAPSGNMIVDIGAGTTEIAVISMSSVIAHETIDVAGEAMDEAVIRYMKREHALLVGDPTAERLKHLAGAVTPSERVTVPSVKGRCLRQGVPRAVDVPLAGLCNALSEPLKAIAAAILRVLDRTPPELASDVVDHGVVLVGGGALLAGIDAVLRDATGLAMVCCENPQHAVAVGAGRVLEELDLMEKIAS